MIADKRAILWTSEEAAKAVGGTLHPAQQPWRARGVSIDSRTVTAGDLFVALKGPTFDGHDFAGDALKRGAVAALAHRAPAGIFHQMPVLMVADTMRALENLGRAARARSPAKIVAVTGSVGKTGTKEALRFVLERQGAVSASQGNLNNQWGLPLSLARLSRDAAFGVFEMGMSHAGEIASLSRLARPHVAVITTVEAVHSAFFASVDAIADAKAEIFESVEAGGAAILNRDNPQFDRLSRAARAKKIERILAFGSTRDCDVRLIDAELGPDGSSVEAEICGETITYRLAIPGRHWVVNSLAVLAAVAAAGADVIRASAALSGVSAMKGRGQRHAVAIDGGAFTLVDESYNASPASVRAALEALGRMQPSPGGRRIAVLGDMLELGTAAEALHESLAEPVVENAIDLMFAAGPNMGRLWSALPKPTRGEKAVTSADLAPAISAAVRPGDVITVKGSLGSRMGLIVEALLALGRGTNAPRKVVNGA